MILSNHNSWRVEQANRAAVLIDAACYFGALRKALLKARSTVFVVAKTNTYSDGTCSQGASSNSGENSLEQRPDGCDVRKLHPRDEARKRLTIPTQSGRIDKQVETVFKKPSNGERFAKTHGRKS